MGQEILYCHSCGKKLLSEDFTRGRAHTFDNRQFCTGCVPRAPSSPQAPPAKAPSPTARTKKEPTSRVPLAQVRPAPPPASGRGKMWLAFGFGVLIPMAAAVMFLWKSEPENPEPPPPPPRPVSLPTPPRPDPGEPARNPAAYAKEIHELETKGQPFLEREQYAAVLDLLEEARKRHPDSEWSRIVQKKIDEVRSLPASQYRSIKEKAAGAQLRGAGADVQSLRSRVVSWGIQEWVDDLDKALALVIPREPLPAGAKILVQYPDHLLPKIRVVGNRTDAGLVSQAEKDHAWAGLESGYTIFKPSENQEVRMTISTNRPALITMIFRATPDEGGAGIPYNFWLKDPVVGRPQTVKFSVLTMKDWGEKLIRKGLIVNNIYFRQDDPTAVFTIHDFVVFSTKD